MNTYPVGALMKLTDGDEKCVLKLCVYKTPFGESGHIHIYIYIYIYMHTPFEMSTFIFSKIREIRNF